MGREAGGDGRAQVGSDRPGELEGIIAFTSLYYSLPPLFTVGTTVEEIPCFPAEVQSQDGAPPFTFSYQ